MFMKALSRRSAAESWARALRKVRTPIPHWAARSRLFASPSSCTCMSWPDRMGFPRRMGGWRGRGPELDFFVSYNGADRAWAEWVGWQLERAGYRVFLQAWDIAPGHDFVHEMQR